MGWFFVSYRMSYRWIELPVSYHSYQMGKA